MIKPGKFGHLHLVYHLTVPLRIKLFLNKGLAWELYSWMLIILRDFFVKWQDNYLHYNSETIQVSSN